MRSRVDVSRLQATVALVQPLVISFAVIVGGIWTLYTFRAQLHEESARAELEKLKRELVAAPRLQIDIEVAQIDVPDAEERHIHGTITVKNVGSADTLLRFPDKPIEIHQVTAGEREIWLSVRQLDLPGTESLVCHVGATKRVQFVTTLSEAGLYVVNFGSARNTAEASMVKELGANEGPIEWRAAHYFIVR